MTATDPTLAGLLRAVLEAPEDDVPRLIYADRLDELGDHERAEFIRVQVELASRKWEPTGNEWQEHDALRRRERELFAHVRELLPKELGATLTLSRAVFDSPRGGPFALVRRGFVESVSCDLATFMGRPCGRCGGDGINPNSQDVFSLRCSVCHGTGRTPGVAPRLFASQPVRHVTIIGEGANEWPSERCVAYGRKLAGLPLTDTTRI